MKFVIVTSFKYINLMVLFVSLNVKEHEIWVRFTPLIYISSGLGARLSYTG